MRFRALLLLGALLATALAVGCGANEVKMGTGGSSPTPDPGPLVTPDPAGFAAVQAWLDDPEPKAHCGRSGCHLGPTGSGLLVLVTTSNAAPADVEANREILQCQTFTTSFEAPFGAFYSTFCETDGSALTPPQHAGRTQITDADCAAAKAWLETGSGTPADCP